MKRIITLLFFTLCVVFDGTIAHTYSLRGFSASQDQLSDQLRGLINKQLMNPLRSAHNSVDASMFSRAYIGSSWKYDLITTPTKQKGYYVFRLREYRGSFIINQNSFRVYEDDERIAMEDWENKKYVSVNEWLDMYKKQDNAGK